MKSELIIRHNSTDIDFALLRDGRLFGLHKEDNEPNHIAVGDIFLTKVGKVVSGLNAAFVDVSSEKDGFLHYHDLGPQLKSMLKYLRQTLSGNDKDKLLKNFKPEVDIIKDDTITNVLKAGQNILVQVVKEPISTKGPRLSAELSIAGRYMVLLPFSDRVSVSQKISNRREKTRLKKLVKSIKPKGFGIILRTVAEKVKLSDLKKDLDASLNKWVTLSEKLSQQYKKPTKVLSEVNKTYTLLRDLLNGTFTGIYVDDYDLAEDIKAFLKDIAPDQTSIVKHYTSRVPIFEKFGVERQIKTSFGKTVSMTTGAYLVIEHTEALHVIDVNSGNRSNKADSQQDTALQVNMIAAKEIARQLQLRDMGGIIVVDFIDMHSPEDRKKLFAYLKEQMDADKTKHKILPPSRFGLIQITRQRVREEITIDTKEPNPNGNNKVEAPIVLIDKIELEIEGFVRKGIYKTITLHVHPFVAAYIKLGFKSIRIKWFMRYKNWISIIERDSFRYLQYHIEAQKRK